MTADITQGSDLDVAIAAAQAGAEVLRAMYGAELARIDKSATDFATAADIASERAILEIIRAARPDDAFVGEELGSLPGSHHTRVWLVDPLCGTLNFAASTPLYCVNVALSSDGVTTAAAVANPPSNEVYWSEGARFGILGRHSSAPVPANLLVDINADGPLDRGFVGAQLAADPGFRGRFSPHVESTTLTLAWVAAGQRLAYVTDGRHRDSVHFSAGIALCRAAGCTITDFDGSPVHTGPGIVAAADERTHTALLELIAKHRAADRGSVGPAHP